MATFKSSRYEIDYGSDEEYDKLPKKYYDQRRMVQADKKAKALNPVEADYPINRREEWIAYEADPTFDKRFGTYQGPQTNGKPFEGELPKNKRPIKQDKGSLALGKETCGKEDCSTWPHSKPGVAITSADIVNFVQHQNQGLNIANQNKAEFLVELQPPGLEAAQRVSSIRSINQKREQEPSMKDILTWGLFTECPKDCSLHMHEKDIYIGNNDTPMVKQEKAKKFVHEFPDKNDYTKNNASHTNKIKKMQTPFISEAHDNFRKPEVVLVTEQQKENNVLFNYFDAEEKDLQKKREYKMAHDQMMEYRNKTMYGEQFNTKTNQEWSGLTAEIKHLTTAGKSSRDVNALKKLTRMQPVATKEEMLAKTAWLEEIDFDGEPYEKPGVGGPFGEQLQKKEKRDKIKDPKAILQDKINSMIKVKTLFALSDHMEQNRKKTANETYEAENHTGYQIEQRTIDDVEVVQGHKRAASAGPTRAQQIEINRRLDELKRNGRLNADSAMTTYFGKPAFHTYGNGNTKTLDLENYLKTHNINPHSGDNHPLLEQVFNRAMQVPQVKAGRKEYIQETMQEQAKANLKKPGYNEKGATKAKKARAHAEMLNGTKTVPAQYQRKPIGPRVALGIEASKNDRDKYATDHNSSPGKDKAGDKKSPVKAAVKKPVQTKLEPKAITAKPFTSNNQIPINKPNIPVNKNVVEDDVKSKKENIDLNVFKADTKSQISKKAPSMNKQYIPGQTKTISKTSEQNYNDDDEASSLKYGNMSEQESSSKGQFVSQKVGGQSAGLPLSVQNKSWLPQEFAQQMMVGKENQTFLRDPKNYKFLPYDATKKIDMAGRATAPSDHVEEVICMKTNKFY